MLTDWVLIRRLAAELDERLRRARLADAGLLGDGRIGLLFRSRAARCVLAIDLFASPPLVTIEDEELGIAAEPGFVRALARSLEGMILTKVSARRDDRLLRLSFAARSRFGVDEQLELYVELVPRFGNCVLVKGDRVVAARKEFVAAERARRSVRAGEAYEFPPLPARVRTLAPSSGDGDVTAPLDVYRRAGKLVAAYVVPLEGFEDAAHSREPSLLTLFAELREQQRADAGALQTSQRRRAIVRRLDDREAKLRAELVELAQRRRRADERQALREEGERIFAGLHELDGEARDAEKARAAKLFAQYKKLGKSVPHVDARERAIGASLAAVETLRWEAERAADEDLGEVAAAMDAFAPRDARRKAPPAPKRKRALLEFHTEHGSRIVVGRSPIENAELTFRYARPQDLWFHARGIPGAHVILRRDDRTPAPDDDLRLAASLAAFHSRAKSSASVPVDYTLRKHVRKQRDAAPGLVWYTNASTIVAQPRAG